MPRRVYLNGEYRPGGGVQFHVTWEAFERMLRGEPTLALKPDEICEFVVTPTGVNVYVEKNDAHA